MRRWVIVFAALGSAAIVSFVYVARAAVGDRLPAANGAGGKLAPHVASIGAIVEADVVNARCMYDEHVGPRTAFDLANVVVHAGPASVPSTLSQFGGPLPDGSDAVASELPVLTPGSRYILFLTSRPWFWTPVHTRLYFRIEDVGGKRVVLGPTGVPVLAFGADGPSYGQARIVDTDGPIDPIAPLFRSPLADTAPDVTAALDPNAFVTAAVGAAKAAGAPLGAPVAPSPSPLGPDWRTIRGGAR